MALPLRHDSPLARRQKTTPVAKPPEAPKDEGEIDLATLSPLALLDLAARIDVGFVLALLPDVHEVALGFSPGEVVGQVR